MNYRKFNAISVHYEVGKRTMNLLSMFFEKSIFDTKYIFVIVKTKK